MKMRCLLIDDEPPALKVLQSHIDQISGLEIVGLCNNAVEAIDLLHRHTVDVMFLDIKMPKIIGTEFLRSLSHPPKVIFVTAYREYAVEGFELDAVDYLVKPVSFERFLKAIDRLTRSTGQQTVFEEKLYMNNPDAFIYLKIDRIRQKIFLKDIVYIESWKDYVKLYFTNRKDLLVKQPISAIENLLSEHMFLRVHRSYIISLNKISGYSNTSIQLGSNDIPVGRLYKQNVMYNLQKGNTNIR
jgi:DNA-binding LytR/AlgR family response regulator